MSKHPVLNAQGEQVSDVDLKDELFKAPVKNEVLYYTAVAQLSNQHQGTASAKKRGEVRGGGSKPWPQKGTGNARHGSIRSPLWTGGGVIFGPSPERNYKRKVPRKVKKQALKSALSAKLRDEKLLIVDSIDLEEPKTKVIRNILENLKVKSRALLVIAQPDENIVKSVRNLPATKLVIAPQLNVLDLLNSDYLVLTREALQEVEEVFAK